ncbi:MAG: RNA-binding S4 domain-containing protein [Bacteroidales bacterium]
MTEKETVRIDKWLWAVRLFKTRSLATEACKAGKVKIDGQSVKPSREVKVGDVYNINLGSLNKTVEVKACLHNRVSARLVPDYLTDLTPPEEYERQQLIREMNSEKRPKGAGRPTKLERRLIDKLKNSF